MRRTTSWGVCATFVSFAGIATAQGAAKPAPAAPAQAAPAAAAPAPVAAPADRAAPPAPEAAPAAAPAEAAEPLPAETETTAELSVGSGGANGDPTADSAGGAEDKSDTIGIDLVLGTGWSVPAGEFVEDAKLNEVFDGVFPLQLDVGYRITDNIVVGLYGMYGVGFFAGKNDFTCDDTKVPDAQPGDEFMEVSCKAAMIRFGVQARYHFRPEAFVDPWVGVGIGMERVSIESSDLDTSFSLTGTELINARAGLDIDLGANTRAGPYVQFSVAKYSTFDFSCGADACTFDDQEIDSKGSHLWATGGIRLSRIF